MAPRANWKGLLKIGQVSCPVALYTAVTTSDRIAFHTLNRRTGNRARRIYMDSDTGKTVEYADQAKGYELASGELVMLDPDEIAAAVPDSDKTLAISAFITCDDIDSVYFDKHYYLAPAGADATEAFNLIRAGIRARKVAALAQTVLFRRVRTVLIRAHGDGLIATTLNFDYEVRQASEAFDDIPDLKIDKEMLDLAQHIIKTKSGRFDPRDFEDRYEAALADLVKAKLSGKNIAKRKEPAGDKIVDLMAALRESAGKDRQPPKKTAAKKPGAKKTTRKAG